jgi:hypothetical protein
MLRWIWNSEGTKIRLAHDNEPWTAGAEYRGDLKTFEQAKVVAKALTDSKEKGRFIATDSGGASLPAFDVIRLAEVGDPVSYAFNGDYYPCGHIVSVSKTLKRITAEDDKGRRCVFNRVRSTGCWRMNGTWSLVSGHIKKQNPHF